MPWSITTPASNPTPLLPTSYSFLECASFRCSLVWTAALVFWFLPGIQQVFHLTLRMVQHNEVSHEHGNHNSTECSDGFGAMNVVCCFLGTHPHWYWWCIRPHHLEHLCWNLVLKKVAACGNAPYPIPGCSADPNKATLARSLPRSHDVHRLRWLGTHWLASCRMEWRWGPSKVTAVCVLLEDTLFRLVLRGDQEKAQFWPQRGCVSPAVQEGSAPPFSFMWWETPWKRPETQANAFSHSHLAGMVS